MLCLGLRAVRKLFLLLWKSKRFWSRCFHVCCYSRTKEKKKKPEQIMYLMVWNTWRAACSYFVINIIRMCKGISFFVSFRNSTVFESQSSEERTKKEKTIQRQWKILPKTIPIYSNNKRICFALLKVQPSYTILNTRQCCAM